MTAIRRHSRGLAQLLLALAFVITVAVVLALANHAAARNGAVQLHPNAGGLTLGNVGTQVEMLAVGTVDVADGKTSKSLTVTGLLPGDIPIVTPAESIGSAARFWAVASTDSLKVDVNTDPGTTVTFNYAVYGLPQ